MQVSTKFTIAIHILTAIEYFHWSQRVTSEFLAGSIGTNPVIVRGLMQKLHAAGLIVTKRGPGGMELSRSLTEITFLDVYRAVETGSGEPLFHIHEHPSSACPIGRNIRQSLEGVLQEIQQNFERDLASHRVSEVYCELAEAIGRQTS